MSEFVPPDQVSWSVDEGSASIRLGGVSVSNPVGWTVLNRATLLVVDGPGDEGFLVKRLGPDGQDLAPPGWDDAVATGGVTVVATDDGTTVEAAGG